MRMRCAAAIPGWCGPAAMIASGTTGQPHLRRLRAAQDPVVESTCRLLHWFGRKAQSRIRVQHAQLMQGKAPDLVYAEPQQSLLLVRVGQRAMLRASNGA